MGDEVSRIDYAMPVYEIKQPNPPAVEEDDAKKKLEKSEEAPPTRTAESQKLSYTTPGHSSQAQTPTANPATTTQATEADKQTRLSDSITKLAKQLEANRPRLEPGELSSTQDPGLTDHMQRVTPALTARFVTNPKTEAQSQNQKLSLAESTRQDQIILKEAQRLQELGRIDEAQKLIDAPQTRNTFVRIHDLREGLISELNTNTGEITQAQTALDSLNESRSNLDPISQRLTENYHENQKSQIEYYIAGKLGTRQYQVHTMMEANELVEAGKYSEAESLLNGSMSLYELSRRKLQESNPNAPRQTNPDGSVKTSEEVVKDTREALQETINANRAGLEQLDKQIGSLTAAINGQAPAAPLDPLGIFLEPKAPELSTEQRLELMEQRNLLSIQQDRLRQETERLFTAHDKITEAANKGDLEQARDMAEGRTAVLNPNERMPRSQASLKERSFARSKEEEAKYQAAKEQLDELAGAEQSLGILIRGDAEDREGGLEFKITETKKDIDESGVLSSLGGRTEALRKTLGAEQANKKELEQLETVVSDIKSQAQKLITEGRYEEAQSLLQASNQSISERFQDSNRKLQQAYKGATEQLQQFDRNLKDSAVQGAKVIAITGVAAALAPATGGGSLAALTALGTGTLAGIGVGVAIDSVDAAINVGAFNESFSEAASRVVSRENIYNNAKTAFSGALAGSSGAQILARLEKFGAVATASGSAGGASALVTTVNLTEQRIQAEIAYNDALKSDPNLDKDKFMEERGVSATQLAKAFAVDSSVGALSGLVGLRAGGIKEAARTGVTKAATEAGEEAANAVIGLAGAYVNDGQLTAESIRDELMAATVGNRVGRHANEIAEPRRLQQNQGIDINEPGRLDLEPEAKPIKDYSTKLETEGKQSFDSALQQIKAVFPEEVAQRVSGRSKSSNSIERKLEKKNNAGVNLSDIDSARAVVGDLIGARLVLPDTKPETIDRVVDSLAKAIENGSIQITEINNYRGNNSEPYFSRPHLQKLKEAAYRAGTDLVVNDAKDSIKDSGYTTTQMNVVFASGALGEFQIRGEKVNILAEAEHLPYDARQGKDLTGGNLDFEPVVRDFASAMQNLTEQQYSDYNNYLSSMYGYSRGLENGLALKPPSFPKNLPIVLNYDSLQSIYARLH